MHNIKLCTFHAGSSNQQFIFGDTAVIPKILSAVILIWPTTCRSCMECSRMPRARTGREELDWKCSHWELCTTLNSCDFMSGIPSGFVCHLFCVVWTVSPNGNEQSGHNSE